MTSSSSGRNSKNERQVVAFGKINLRGRKRGRGGPLYY